jgi:hypothetical protein
VYKRQAISFNGLNLPNPMLEVFIKNNNDPINVPKKTVINDIPKVILAPSINLPKLSPKKLKLNKESSSYPTLFTCI